MNPRRHWGGVSRMKTETLPARWLTVVAIVFAGINLRPAIVSVSPLLQAVRLDLSLSSSTVGLLITLPVLPLGLASPFHFVLLGRLTHSEARKSSGKGQRVSVRVYIGGSRLI